MVTRIVSKLFSGIVLLAMAFSLCLPPSTAIAQSPAKKPEIPANTLIGTPASDQEISEIKARADGTVNVMLELVDQPTSLVYAQSLKSAGIQSASLSAIDAFNQIQQSQQTLVSALSAQKIDATVLYQVHAAYNGVAVKINFDQLKQLKTLPGLKAIHAIISKSPDNWESVPFIGAPAVWQLGLTGVTGAGIKIGVIDTGIDYLHTDFGGSGTGYDTYDFTTIGDPGDPYPTTKVAGGWDFAGDAYDPDPQSTTYQPIPTPDPNPMDCAGHGSHVSGTIAGYGVNGDGSTYTGSYGEGMDFSSFLIGPGVAPEATLYALRVFGCEGPTDLVTEAIDRAVDPNMDGDPSDHLDVINMSLGSPFGSTYDPDAVASDNAAEAGVIVVASAGNAYDTHYITGSPSVSTRAISVASSISNVAYSGFEVNSSTDSGLVGIYPAAPGSPSNVTDPGVTADLKSAPDETRTVNSASYTAPFGCAAPDEDYYTGKIAMVARGYCSFHDKAMYAEAAGAVGIIIYNHSSYIVAAGDPSINMDMSGTPPITIPNMFMTNANAQPIADELAAEGTINGTIAFSTRYTPAVSPADTIDSFSSRGGRRYDSFLKPDISAPGDNIISVAALTGDQAEYLSGTSMASPHIAGVMALLRALHPSWSVEELKALVMNTATHDLTTQPEGAGLTYTPARIGAGRVDVFQASQSLGVAYNAEDSGAVSLSFGVADVPVEQTDFTMTKQFTVENKGGSTADPITYDLAYQSADSWTVEGVDYAILDSAGDPISQITLDPGTSVTLTLKMTVDGTMLTRAKDLTMAASQNGGSRFFMTESGGYITLTVPFAMTGVDRLNLNELRVPVYAVVRPVASMTADQTSFTAGSSGTTNVNLTGTGIGTGLLASQNSLNVPAPTPYISMVTALELKYVGEDQGLSPEAASANIQYVGVMSDVQGEEGVIANTEVFFGISTFGKWSTASAGDTEFDIYIDSTGDGVPDYVVWNSSVSDSNGNASDAFYSKVYDYSTGYAYYQDYINGLPGGFLDTNAYNNNVIVIPVLADYIGLTDENTSFSFWIYSYTRESDLVDIVGGDNGISYDAKYLPIDTTDGSTGAPIYFDLPDTQIPVSYNYAYEGSDGMMSVLLLHHHNAFPDTAQVVDVRARVILPLIMNNGSMVTP